MTNRLPKLEITHDAESVRLRLEQPTSNNTPTTLAVRLQKGETKKLGGFRVELSEYNELSLSDGANNGFSHVGLSELDKLLNPLERRTTRLFAELLRTGVGFTYDLELNAGATEVTPQQERLNKLLEVVDQIDHAYSQRDWSECYADIEALGIQPTDLGPESKSSGLDGTSKACHSAELVLGAALFYRDDPPLRERAIQIAQGFMQEALGGTPVELRKPLSKRNASVKKGFEKRHERTGWLDAYRMAAVGRQKYQVFDGRQASLLVPNATGELNELSGALRWDDAKTSLMFVPGGFHTDLEPVLVDLNPNISPPLLRVQDQSAVRKPDFEAMARAHGLVAKSSFVEGDARLIGQQILINLGGRNDGVFELVHGTITDSREGYSAFTLKTAEGEVVEANFQHGHNGVAI